MKNSFSLQQIQKTSNLDANLKSRQYNLNLMADFIRLKFENIFCLERENWWIKFTFFFFYKHIHHHLLQLNIYFDNYIAL